MEAAVASASDGLRADIEGGSLFVRAHSLLGPNHGGWGPKRDEPLPDFWGSTPSTDLNTPTPDDKTQTRLIGTGNGSILTRVLPYFDGRVWQSDGDSRLR